MIHKISRAHPRASSLMIREKLVNGFRNGIVVPQGLIAHGRGEAFDYLLGEKTSKHAYEAEKVAVCLLLLSNKSIISINGNAAALCPKDLVTLAKVTNSRIAVNLFHKSGDRTESLVRMGKKVISVDLNPLSRTAIASNITIIDNIVRAIPNMIKISEQLNKKDNLYLLKQIRNFDNKGNMDKSLLLMKKGI